MYPFINEPINNSHSLGLESWNEFVETIRIEGGKAQHLSYHNERMNRTRRAFWGDDLEELRAEDWITVKNVEQCTRCRLVYAREVREVQYFPYEMRSVRNLKLVTCDEADYEWKRTDRTLLNTLFALRETADDVLVVRRGLLTDTSIANIALFDGRIWSTPASPLLKGTCRQRLLDEGKISETDIPASDIKRYQKIRLFNAMIPFGKIEIDTSHIV